jgi:hypothetical protein
VILENVLTFREFVQAPMGTGAAVVYPNGTSTAVLLPTVETLAAGTPAADLPQPIAAFLFANHSAGDVLIRFGVDSTIKTDAAGTGATRIPAGKAILYDETEPTATATYVAVAGQGGGPLMIYGGMTVRKLFYEDVAASPDPFDLINQTAGNPGMLQPGFPS